MFRISMSKRDPKMLWYPLLMFSLALLMYQEDKRMFSTEEDYLKAKPEVVQQWQDDRFGLFIHWGPVSLRGTEIGWSRGGERRGWPPSDKGEVPVNEYDNLFKQFNPTLFDAKQWVDVAKAAGVKYLVFTTKHHDGFCMFDTRLTDHKITSPDSPFGRDVTAELAKACHEGGLRLGFYYSPVDWYDENYRTKYHEKYIQYMHGQLRELLTNYGRVDIMWFDGLQVHEMPGDPPGGRNLPEYARDWDSHAMLRMIRQLQPQIIINNRGGLDADFGTPEQHVGLFQTERPWESCITLGEQWSWKPNDKVKTPAECIHLLVQSATGNGNFLLNVGPMPNGQIEPRQVAVLREIGTWLDTYGESIYGTRGGPVRNGEWGGTTFKENRVYVHVLKWPGGRETITLSPLRGRIVKSELLRGGKVDVTQQGESVSLKVHRVYRDAIDTVIKLEIAVF